MRPYGRRPVDPRPGRLELLADLAYTAVGPGSEDRWGCVAGMVALAVVAAGIGAMLYRFAF